MPRKKYCAPIPVNEKQAELIEQLMTNPVDQQQVLEQAGIPVKKRTRKKKAEEPVAAETTAGTSIEVTDGKTSIFDEVQGMNSPEVAESLTSLNDAIDQYNREQEAVAIEWDRLPEEEKKRILANLRTYKTPTMIKPVKVGRNDKCPCGSGKKYKNCCLHKGDYETYISINEARERGIAV